MLEEKLDLLTKEIVALRKAVEENTASGGATNSGKAAASSDDTAKPKRGRGRPKAEEVTPDHDADEVETKVREVSKTLGRAEAVKIIKSFKCDDLADLLTHPEHFDAAFEKAEAALEADSGGDEDEEAI